MVEDKHNWGMCLNMHIKSLQRNIFTIQIFGDSLNVIKWVNGNSSCQNQILKTLLEEILFLKSSFNSFTICHIYRDKNEEADQLSKAGLQQDMGSWSIEELSQGQSSTSHQPPFALPQWSRLVFYFVCSFMGTMIYLILFILYL